MVPFCPSAALPEVGSYIAREAAGVPLVRRTLPDQVARGTFAPRIDAPYRQRLEQTRVVAGETARYTAERTVRFARDGEGGFRAEVTLVAIDPDMATARPPSEESTTPVMAFAPRLGLAES